MSKEDDLRKAIEWAAAQDGGDGARDHALRAAEERASRRSKPLVPARHPDDRSGMLGTKASDMLRAVNAEGEGRMAQGPSTGDRDASGKKLPEWLTGYR